MEKYFCNYNQSLALKELGFDEPCFGTWKKDVDGNNPTKYTIDFHTKVQLDHDLCPKNSDYINDWVSAPLKSQVFEWFRKNHLLGHEINCPFVSYSGKNAEIRNEGRYEMFITDEDQLSISDEEFYSTDYFEAESKAIDKLIEIVKNK